MEQGPCTAAAVAADAGAVGPGGAPPPRRADRGRRGRGARAPRRGPRGRGRPARHYLLTDAGRARFGHGYDDLAVSALRYLAAHAGEQAVDGFADQPQRVELLGAAADAGRRGRRPARSGSTALARVLAARGYAAQIREVGTGRHRGVPAVPAPLPGRPRGRRVPGAVRGRDRARSPSCSARTCSASRPSRAATPRAPPTSRSRLPNASTVTDPHAAGPPALRARRPTGVRIRRTTTAPAARAGTKGGSPA